jgi:hypothetical protein
MNRFLTAVFLTFFVNGALYAEDFTTLDGDHYYSATIKRVEPDGLVIAYADGVKKLTFRNLPPEIGKQYGYDPAVASQYLAQQQASAAASYQAAIQPPQPANISQNIAASIPSSLTQTSAVVPTSTQQAIPQSTAGSQTTTNLSVVQASPITPIVPSISNTIKTLFTNVYINIKQSVKSFLLKWLHILFPWAFPNSTSASMSPTPIPPNPDEIVRSVLSKDTIQANDLGRVCSQFPDISNEYLQDKPFKINGLIDKIWLSGIDHDTAEITFRQGFKRKITVLYNLKKYHDLNVGCDETEESWKIVGSQLFYQSRNRTVASKNSDQSTSANKVTSVLVCASGMPFPEKTVRLCKKNPASVYFEVEF